MSLDPVARIETMCAEALVAGDPSTEAGHQPGSFSAVRRVERRHPDLRRGAA